MQTKKIALAVALAAAAASACATDIQIYGRADAGLLYEDVDGKSESLTMKSGGRSASRLGFNIKEDLGNGNFVKVYLENGFKLDDGSMSTKNTLFDRRAILAVQGAWGELGMGRAGTVQSTSAPYSMGAIKWDVFGTSYSNASIATTFANSSRVNNSINYISPVISNFKFGLSYSTGDKSEENAAEEPLDWQEKQHTLAAAVNYQTENVFLALTFANVDQAHSETTGIAPADGRAYQMGGWVRLNPTMRLFAGAGWQTDWSTGAKLGTGDIVIGHDDVEDKDITLDGGWDGYSAVLGFEYKTGPHKIMADVQHFNGEASKYSSYEFKRTIYAAAYEYSFAKNVIGYTALNFSDASGSALNSTSATAAKDTWQGFVGLCYLF